MSDGYLMAAQAIIAVASPKFDFTSFGNRKPNQKRGIKMREDADGIRKLKMDHARMVRKSKRDMAVEGKRRVVESLNWVVWSSDSEDEYEPIMSNDQIVTILLQTKQLFSFNQGMVRESDFDVILRCLEAASGTLAFEARQQFKGVDWVGEVHIAQDLNRMLLKSGAISELVKLLIKSINNVVPNRLRFCREIVTIFKLLADAPNGNFLDELSASGVDLPLLAVLNDDALDVQCYSNAFHTLDTLVKQLLSKPLNVAQFFLLFAKHIERSYTIVNSTTSAVTIDYMKNVFKLLASLCKSKEESALTIFRDQSFISFSEIVIPTVNTLLRFPDDQLLIHLFAFLVKALGRSQLVSQVARMDALLIVATDRLSSGNENMIAAATEVLASLTSSGPDMNAMRFVVSHPNFVMLANYFTSPGIDVHALRILTNISCSDMSHVLINETILEALKESFYFGDIESQTITTEVITNLVQNADYHQLQMIIGTQIMDALCDMLSRNEPEPLYMALEAFRCYFTRASQFDTLKQALKSSSSAVIKIEKAIDHGNERVSHAAITLLSTFIETHGDDALANLEAQVINTELW